MKTRAWTTRPSAAGATVKATADCGRSDRVQLHARQSRRWPSAAAVLILCAVASWASWAVCDAMPPLPTTNTTSAVATGAWALNHVSMAVVFRLLAADRRCQAPSRPSIAWGVTHRTHCRKEGLRNATPCRIQRHVQHRTAQNVHWRVRRNVPRSFVPQSSVDHVPSNVVPLTIATIDIEHRAASVGRNVSNAVAPTTPPVRLPDIESSGPKSVKNPVTTDPTWNNVIVAVLCPVDTLVNHPSHESLSGALTGVGVVGATGPPSPQATASTASRTAPMPRMPRTRRISSLT